MSPRPFYHATASLATRCPRCGDLCGHAMDPASCHCPPVCSGCGEECSEGYYATTCTGDVLCLEVCWDACMDCDVPLGDDREVVPGKGGSEGRVYCPGCGAEQPGKDDR